MSYRVFSSGPDFRMARPGASTQVKSTRLTLKGVTFRPTARATRTAPVDIQYPDNHILKQVWPAFLDTLEQSVTGATHEFAVFAYRLLTSNPPKILRDQSPQEREDWIQDIILHFTDDECRVLREYRNTGHPFAAWFITVVNHKAYDFYRRSAKQRGSVSSLDEQYQPPASTRTADDPAALSEFGEILGKVRDCLRKMTGKCQMLLQAAAEEYNPREMVTLLGEGERSNKQMSDDLRACRKRLRTLLNEEGVDLRRYL